MGVEVRQKNPQWLEQLKQRCKQQNLEAALGYPREKLASSVSGAGAAESRADVLDAALRHNFGTETTARQAFMERAANKIRPEFARMMREAVKRINSGESTLREVLEGAAKMGEDEIRKAIMNGEGMKNRSDYAGGKGPELSLMDSGIDSSMGSAELCENVTSVVRARTK